MTDLKLTGDNKKARGAAIGATGGRRLFSTAVLVGGGLAVMTMVNVAPWRNPFRAATGNPGGGGGVRTNAVAREAGREALPTSHPDPGRDFWWMASLHANPTSTVSLGFEAPRLLQFPVETKQVWIDVGVNKKSDFILNMDMPGGHDLFVVGYEPSVVWSPSPHPRCVVLWAAATPRYDVVEVNVQGRGALCDSLFKPNPETSSKLWRGCVTQQTTKDGRPMTVQAPGVPLSEVVSRIPDNINIEYIKIDAQGYDLEVMKGALSVSERLQVVSLEVMDVQDRSLLLYKGQPTLDDVKDFFAKEGWKFVKSVSNHGALGEVNAFFVYKDEHAAKVDHLADVLMGNKEGKGEK
jgi:Methyltransferase FkbM domain